MGNQRGKWYRLFWLFIVLSVILYAPFGVNAQETGGETTPPEPTGAEEVAVPEEEEETSPSRGETGTEGAPSEEVHAATPPPAAETATAPVPTEAEEEVPSNDDEPEEAVEVIEEIEVVAAVDADESGFFPSEFDGVNAIRRDRGVNVFTARTTRKQALVFTVDHRPFENLFSGEDAFFNFLGLDGNLKIGLGLRYGIIDGLDVGMVRLNDAGVLFDAYEWDLRWGFLRQEKHHIDASVRAGVTWFSQKDAKDAAGGFVQAFVDRVFFDMLLVGLGFAFHSSSTNDDKLSTDAAYSGAILGVVEWRMVRWLAWTAEVSASVMGYRSDWPALAFAVKFLTHRHSFSLILTNTQFIAADGIVSNSGRDFTEIVFGFQIIREFNFGGVEE